MNISIFAKKPFRKRSDRHMMRVSSIIRGYQVAEQIGARINPTTGYENDICIYVKPHVKLGNDFKFEGKPFLDIIDGWDLIPLLKRHPEVPVIVCSLSDYEIMLRSVSNDVILIPQHHCNFERVKRNRDEVTTVGVIGTASSFTLLPPNVKMELSKRGMNLIEFSTFSKREDIINFYQKIDVQIIWNPRLRNKIRLANPLKIVNASSFGIPTIALEDYVWKEMDSCCIQVQTFDEFLTQLDALRFSSALYIKYSEQCLSKAEGYHIENIAKLYLKLN